MIYLWIKVFHVTAVIAFVGGLLMQSVLLRSLADAPLPRMPEVRRLLIAMKQWDRLVTIPAMLLVWTLGMTMAVKAHWFGASWLSIKLVMVVALSGLHGVQAGSIRRMIGDNVGRVSGHFRFASWFALASSAMIVCLAMLKPF